MRILFPRIGRLGIVVLLSSLVLLSGCINKPKPLSPYEIAKCRAGDFRHTSHIYSNTRDYFTLRMSEGVGTVILRVLFFPFQFPFLLLLDTVKIPNDIHSENSYQSQCKTLKKEAELSLPNEEKQKP